MNTTETRPVVCDVIREAGVTAAELCSVLPRLSPHMARHIVAGTSTGVTYARVMPRALRQIAEQREAAEIVWGARGCRRVRALADSLESAYPPVRVPAASAEPKGDTDALVIFLAKRKHSFASIGRRVGLTRAAVSLRIKTYERRTGEKIPRCGTDYKRA